MLIKNQHTPLPLLRSVGLNLRNILLDEDNFSRFNEFLTMRETEDDDISDLFMSVSNNKSSKPSAITNNLYNNSEMKQKIFELNENSLNNIQYSKGITDESSLHHDDDCISINTNRIDEFDFDDSNGGNQVKGVSKGANTGRDLGYDFDLFNDFNSNINQANDSHSIQNQSDDIFNNFLSNDLSGGDKNDDTIFNFDLLNNEKKEKDHDSIKKNNNNNNNNYADDLFNHLEKNDANSKFNDLFENLEFNHNGKEDNSFNLSKLIPQQEKDIFNSK